MKDQIRSMVVDKFGLPVGTPDDEILFSSGLLDSLSAVQLLVYLEETVGVSLSPLEVGLDDVDSIDAIFATVERFQQK